MVVIIARHHGDDVIEVERIDHILDANHEQGGEPKFVAITSSVSRFALGEWSSPLPAEMRPAVKAAAKKAHTYHCRTAVWVQPVGRRR